ncbi:MAG: MerR family transcriptional regulator [Oscillospiraceae bacterium]|nr:MerR family transcriptional regulator [Oscillospiraceae bacterium]
MRTVKEISELTGVSVRTLQYYDTIGLLKPTQLSEAGYRLYDDTILEKLQQILLFRELEFPLKEIKTMMDSPDFNRNKALEQQIALLKLKREHLDHLIHFAIGIKMLGVRTLDFTVFQKDKLDEYSRRAKTLWSNSSAYQEFAEHEQNRTDEENRALIANFMALFAEFGKLRSSAPDCPAVQPLVKRLQMYIPEHFYHCTDEILLCLGRMYAGDGEFTENIDEVSGEGTVVFVASAIEIYCEARK